MTKRELRMAARRIAKQINHEWTDPETIRDFCDARTDSALDCTQLDILTDMVLAIKRKREAAGQ